MEELDRRIGSASQELRRIPARSVEEARLRRSVTIADTERPPRPAKLHRAPESELLKTPPCCVPAYTVAWSVGSTASERTVAASGPLLVHRPRPACPTPGRSAERTPKKRKRRNERLRATAESTVQGPCALMRRRLALKKVTGSPYENRTRVAPVRRAAAKPRWKGNRLERAASGGHGGGLAFRKTTGSPYENRTRISALRGPRPNR